MSLLDTTETSKQLENELDKIVMKELRDHYNQADQVAQVIRYKLHDQIENNKKNSILSLL